MSLDNKKEGELNKSVCRRGLEEALGSQYALQIALQTMKERCQQLQQRLSVLEEENLCLRLEKSKFVSDPSETEKSIDSDLKAESLADNVARLRRQKSQLTHHLYMVASENKQLWGRLSMLTEANQSLGSHLTKISHTLKCHGSAKLNEAQVTPPQSPTPVTMSLRISDDFQNRDLESITLHEVGNITSSLAKSASDMKDESMEEMSRKLIKSLLQEKTDLETQYAQMVEMQSGPPSSLSVPPLGFSYLEEEGDEATLEEAACHYAKLLDTRRGLLEQQSALREAVTTIQSLADGGSLCPQCRDRASTPRPGEAGDSLRGLEETGPATEPPGAPAPAADVPALEDRMCPLCSKFYRQPATFDEFNTHVQSHFTEEDDEEEDEPESIIRNFEVAS